MKKEIIKKSLPIVIPLYILASIVFIDFCFDWLRQANSLKNILSLLFLIQYSVLTFFITKQITKQ